MQAAARPGWPGRRQQPRRRACMRSMEPRCTAPLLGKGRRACEPPSSAPVLWLLPFSFWMSWMRSSVRRNLHLRPVLCCLHASRSAACLYCMLQMQLPCRDPAVSVQWQLVVRQMMYAHLQSGIVFFTGVCLTGVRMLMLMLEAVAVKLSYRPASPALWSCFSSSHPQDRCIVRRIFEQWHTLAQVEPQV